MSDHFDVILIGGGVIGASIAWRLARHNFRVLLLDAGHIGSEASSAAAGMLSPGGEFEDPALRDFAIASLGKYAGFIRDIQDDSGLAVEFRPASAVQVALTEAELHPSSLPPGCQLLTREQLVSLAPLVRPDAIGAIHYPNEAIVNPAALMQALRAACLARGVAIRENSPVVEICADSGGVSLAGVRARWAILAAGAWSGGISVTVDGQARTLPRSFPVKGHLLGYQLPPGSLPVTVRRQHTYVLQRADGFTIAGSSTEEAGFDRTIDPQIVSEVAARAGALVPALASLKPQSAWIGFRPGIQAPAPQIGRMNTSRLWLAYGHYRNGILLAPATADRISRELIAARALE